MTWLLPPQVRHSHSSILSQIHTLPVIIITDFAKVVYSACHTGNLNRIRSTSAPPPNVTTQSRSTSTTSASMHRRISSSLPDVLTGYAVPKSYGLLPTRHVLKLPMEATQALIQWTGQWHLHKIHWPHIRILYFPRSPPPISNPSTAVPTLPSGSSASGN